MNDLPAPITASVVLGCAVLIVSVAVVLYRGAVLAGAPPRSARRLALAAGGAQTAWFALTAGIAATGLFHAQIDETVPWIGVGRSSRSRWGCSRCACPLVAAAVSHPRAVALLVAAQTFRVVGGVFLVLLAAGQLRRRASRCRRASAMCWSGWRRRSSPSRCGGARSAALGRRSPHSVCWTWWWRWARAWPSRPVRCSSWRPTRRRT